MEWLTGESVSQWRTGGSIDWLKLDLNNFVLSEVDLSRYQFDLPIMPIPRTADYESSRCRFA